MKIEENLEYRKNEESSYNETEELISNYLPYVQDHSFCQKSILHSRNEFKFRQRYIKIYFTFFLLYTNNYHHRNLKEIKRYIFHFFTINHTTKTTLTERTYDRIVKDVKNLLNDFFPFKRYYNFTDLLNYVLLSLDIPFSEDFMSIFRKAEVNHLLLEKLNSPNSCFVEILNSITPHMSNDFLILFSLSITFYGKILPIENNYFIDFSSKIKIYLGNHILKGISNNLL